MGDSSYISLLTNRNDTKRVFGSIALMHSQYQSSWYQQLTAASADLFVPATSPTAPSPQSSSHGAQNVSPSSSSHGHTLVAPPCELPSNRTQGSVAHLPTMQPPSAVHPKHLPSASHSFVNSSLAFSYGPQYSTTSTNPPQQQHPPPYAVSALRFDSAPGCASSNCRVSSQHTQFFDKPEEHLQQMRGTPHGLGIPVPVYNPFFPVATPPPPAPLPQSQQRGIRSSWSLGDAQTVVSHAQQHLRAAPYPLHRNDGASAIVSATGDRCGASASVLFSHHSQPLTSYWCQCASCAAAAVQSTARHDGIAHATAAAASSPLRQPTPSLPQPTYRSYPAGSNAQDHTGLCSNSVGSHPTESQPNIPPTGFALPRGSLKSQDKWNRHWHNEKERVLSSRTAATPQCVVVVSTVEECRHFCNKILSEIDRALSESISPTSPAVSPSSRGSRTSSLLTSAVATLTLHMCLLPRRQKANEDQRELEASTAVLSQQGQNERHSQQDASKSAYKASSGESTAPLQTTTAVGLSDETCGKSVWIGLDLEGEDMLGSGCITALTISTASCTFVVDVATDCASFMQRGRLAEVLEDGRLGKLMFDCRADAHSLRQLHGVTLVNVCDLQAMATIATSPTGHYLVGLQKVFGRLFVFTSEEEAIRSAAIALFDPASGGSYSVWKQRPLDQRLVAYCALNSKHYFLVFHMLMKYLDYGMHVGARRIAEVRQGAYTKSRQNNRRDF